MNFSDVNWWWLLPVTVPGFALMVMTAGIGGTPAKHLSENFLRRYWGLSAFILLYLGIFWVYYAPVGGRIPNEIVSRILGVTILLVGAGFALVALGNVKRMREEYQRSQDAGGSYIKRDTSKEITPRERVLGVTRNERE